MSKLYRKKPLAIEAVQYTGENAIEILLFMGSQVSTSHSAVPLVGEPLYIETLEGTMRADVEDWIIKGIAGEFYPCKPDIFANSYEEV